MKTMSQVLIAIVAIFMMCVSNVSAQQIYQSTENGICVKVPAGTKVVKDDETILHLQCGDGLVFSAHPMFTENLTPEKLAEGMASVAKEYGFNIAEAAQVEFKTNTLSTVFYCYPVDDVMCCVGAADVNNNDAVCFMFTVTGNEQHESAMETLMKTIEFNADQIQ